MTVINVVPAGTDIKLFQCKINYFNAVNNALEGCLLHSVHMVFLHTKYDLNKTQDKRVIYITLWLPW